MPNSKQRREAERRRLQRQVQRRAQRDARRRRYAVIGSVLGVVVVIGVVVGFLVATHNDNSPAAGPSPTPTPTASAPTSAASSPAAPAAYPCTWSRTQVPAVRKVAVPPTTRPPRTGTTTVRVQTTQGPMVFTLDRKAAPCAVESFVSLAKQKYYDATPCHRLTSGGLSVLQCGDPTGKGTGGPGYSFGDELTGREKYTRGVLAMANSGPNTNGSQFFIVYKDSQLGPQYTVFGTVSSGLSVVDKVAAKGSTPTGDGRPTLPISLTTLTVAH